MYDPLSISLSIGEKLREPRDLLWNGEFQETSFSEGYPGISYFYSALHRAFPYDRWDGYAEAYCSLALRSFREKKMENTSLMNGLSGLGLAVHALANRPQFERLQNQIDDLLMEEVRATHLSYVRTLHNEKTLIPPAFYNFAGGLAGIILYLLERKENPYMGEFAKECAVEMAKLLLQSKSINGKRVRSWYAPKEWLDVEVQDPYLEGGYPVAMPTGILGCLTVLSYAVLDGIRHEEILQAIEALSSWLSEVYQPAVAAGIWNSTVALDSAVPKMPIGYDLMHHTWLAGWPSAAKALILAGRALDQDRLLSFAGDLSRAQMEKSLVIQSGGTSLSIGMAGFLGTASFVNWELKDPDLLINLQGIEEAAIRLFSPCHKYGFRQCSLDRWGEAVLSDVPGFLHGAAGIGTALLYAHNKIEDTRLF